MEAPEVPVGSLIDFGAEPSTSSPLEAMPPKLPDGDSSPGEGASESETTESADSENDLGESPSHPAWGGYRRSSSNESFSSNQSADSAKDEEPRELREFMRHYVEKIFSGGEDLDQEEKAKFGEHCSSENGKAREWFARYVSAQRCNSKCVSEPTFYRLVQSFAVVLFECHQMDDFAPAKSLMTMCFTYYYIGKPQLLPSEAKEKPAGSIDAYLRSANSWLAEKKDIAERLLKNTSAKTENVKGFFGLETKPKGPLARRSDPRAEEQPSGAIPRGRASGSSAGLCPVCQRGHPWRSDPRRPSCACRERWCHMTQEERDDSLRFDENITFGQLGTFTHNMLAFGLNKKLCNDFLKKQAVIGNLDEEQYKLLSDHIEQMAVE
uniref:KIAA0513 n=1 Tax=Sus scrofa TaxID=9823 RepID=A0A286ZTU4_PIG